MNGDPVNGERRRRLARRALDGYASGSDAPIRATAEAMILAERARSVVLVEGISDQMAVEALAGRRGRDLRSEGVVVVPIGGAQAIGRYLSEFGPHGADLRLAGLCDAAEEGFYRRGLAAAGVGAPRDRTAMEALGFFVCVDDLEQELIRAAGRAVIEELLASQGDLVSFRTLQRQPAWRGGEFEAQMHRWLRAGATRNLRYARLLAEAIDQDRAPAPLVAVLGAIGDPGEA